MTSTSAVPLDDPPETAAGARGPGDVRLGELPLDAPVRVFPQASLREVAALMADRGVSAVLVGSEPLAMVTEHDLADALAAGLGPSAEVSQISHPFPVWATPNTTLNDAVRLMARHHIRHLLVLRPDGVVVGQLGVLAAAGRLANGAPA